MDARPILPLIQAPTLVLHRQDFEFIPIAHGRYLAEHIPGARLVELEGTEQSLFWETPEPVLDHVERILTGVRRVAQPTRMLATVLLTDIVNSTERAGELGDRRWQELLTVHDELTGRLVEEFSGSWLRRPATGSWPPSTAPAERSTARWRSGRSWPALASSSGPGCTPARSSCARTMSAASLCTSRPG
jgi:hypothetical protein